MDAILNISISPMMPRWHHSVSMYGHIGEHIYAKTCCADYFFGLHPKSSFGNLTISLIYIIVVTSFLKVLYYCHNVVLTSSTKILYCGHKLTLTIVVISIVFFSSSEYFIVFRKFLMLTSSLKILYYCPKLIFTSSLRYLSVVTSLNTQTVFFPANIFWSQANVIFFLQNIILLSQA